MYLSPSYLSSLPKFLFRVFISFCLGVGSSHFPSLSYPSCRELVRCSAASYLHGPYTTEAFQERTSSPSFNVPNFPLGGTMIYAANSASNLHLRRLYRPPLPPRQHLHDSRSVDHLPVRRDRDTHDHHERQLPN